MQNLLYLRYILNNKYIEEGELQGAVMIPSKEAKQLTYELLENHFIQLQELRKTVSTTQPSKSLYLYYCDLVNVARNQLMKCYQACGNIIVRRQHETDQNSRLLEKHERIESITAALKASGGEDMIIIFQHLQTLFWT